MIYEVELLENILSRLPAKSIGRFRCVSKPWKSLLSNPKFIKTHLNRIKHFPREEVSLLLTGPSNFLYSVDFKYAHDMSNNDMTTTNATKLNFGDYKFEVSGIEDCNIASCDGLVLVEDDHSKVFLVNPTTREIKEVPPTPYPTKPDASCTMYGLGYDSNTDDYKVVNLSYYTEMYDYYYHHDENGDSCSSEDEGYKEGSVSVYSVKNGTWKKVESSPYAHHVVHHKAGVFVDGHIFWLAVDPISDTANPSVLVAFSLEDEEFLEMPPPSPLADTEFVGNKLAALGGCICMCVDKDIWVMKEFSVEESWTKFTVNTAPNKSELVPVCLLGKEQVVFSDEGKLMMYNTEDERSKDIGFRDGYWFGVSFMETLVSPHCTIDATSQG